MRGLPVASVSVESVTTIPLALVARRMSGEEEEAGDDGGVLRFRFVGVEDCWLEVTVWWEDGRDEKEGIEVILRAGHSELVCWSGVEWAVRAQLIPVEAVCGPSDRRDVNGLQGRAVTRIEEAMMLPITVPQNKKL